eukprot:CAMPEP_0182423630 /NCGR_PEP_ID=MMETSP1167-20130531/9701_1 /TAXON_ID=2988 /ORGANISM="Mallomonas Sp, Strain CCMP3275" /LENGTH=278 /DNA_ID=CAMNT_0024602793 /DNA_START=317 /DNA_END=1153 /DNA_ORIENTATION=+
MATSVLAQPSFTSAVIDYISLSLQTPFLRATTIRNLFNEVVTLSPSLPSLWALDILATALRDSSRPNAVSVLLFNKGFHSLVVHRVAHYLWISGRVGLAEYFQSLTSRRYAADIHPACVIGHSCSVASTTSIVIGETAVVGDDVCFQHGVTLGGTGKEGGDRHPKLGRGVYLGAGACVLGNIRIDDGAVVDADSVVTKPVPPYSKVTGVPGRVVSTYRVSDAIFNILYPSEKQTDREIEKDKNTDMPTVGEKEEEKEKERKRSSPMLKPCFHGQGVGT